MVRYDAYGWPINPATGEAWDFAELVADPALPLPKYSLAVRRARDRACPEMLPELDEGRSRRAVGVDAAPKAKRRRRSRRSSRRSARRDSAAAVLARTVAAGPFEAGIQAMARRMDELAKEI
ncbi:MAG: hypothetical protein FOGNACKC_06258 [Anaerolineae bacterium]|nr:hypothetical protein [Anaerolineae bacterium]